VSPGWLAIPAAYLLGSVSFAWLAGRLKGVDLQKTGSCNLGATNAGRVLGKQWFFFVFAADLGKGVAAVLAAQPLAPATTGHLPVLCAAAVVLGHSFSCFHGGKGGKAVATSLGVLLALMPVVGASCFGVWLLAWLIGWKVFRRGAADAVGPASVLGALTLPAGWFLTAPQPWSPVQAPLSVFAILLSALVVVRHRKNLAKLFAGQPAAVPPAPAAATGAPPAEPPPRQSSTASSP
jgi:glycerol-3-phosphate acyltransferase PlsY